MLYDEALARLTRWLEEPLEGSCILPVRGAVGAGKTRLVKEIRERATAASYVDCRGLDMDGVIAALLAEWGYEPGFLRKRKNPLDDAVREQSRNRTELVVLLGNVQWAGRSATSTEPRRIAESLVPALAVYGGRAVRIIMEGDAEQASVRPPLADAGGILLDDGDTHEPYGRVSRLITQHPRLRALAAAEARQIALPVWEALCDALEVPGTIEDLRESLLTMPSDIVTSHIDTTGVERVGFRTDGIHHLFRSEQGATVAEQGRITDALLTGVTHSEHPQRAQVGDHFTEYAAFALPVHAALAGRLPELLDSTAFLVHADYRTIFTGLALAYPHGVPFGTRASAIHYLEADGVEPASQEEWLSWLHWAEMNRGETEFASQLASAAPSLPWTTRWTRWRPYGVLGPSPSDQAAAENLVMGNLHGSPVVATQTALDEDELPDDCDFDADGWSQEQVWSLQDGTPLSGTRIVTEYWAVTGEIERVEGREFEEYEIPLDQNGGPAPRAPESAERLAAGGDGVWVYGGGGGVFVIDVADPNRVVESPSWRDAPLLSTHNLSARWPVPEAAIRPDAPTHRWLEEIFEDAPCVLLDATQLPSGLSDTRSRAFLAGSGLPALEDDLPFAALSDLSETGLQEGSWPAHTPRPSEAGTFYRLGRWMRSDLLLDGATGRVFQGSDSDENERQLASSLPQFLTVLALYWLVRWSNVTTTEERRDATRSLQAWAADIDPITAGHPHWDAIFRGHWDDREQL
ncbi:SUKH-4 family immunity protein [Streptomyces lydicus]|uniref:SUKH-4 family immunity protein n=1 Tax=Streptomyces lydicus TaxID=47763 RepID=UPI00368B8198